MINIIQRVYDEFDVKADDVSRAKMTGFLNRVLDTYSRFRGIAAVKHVALVSWAVPYILPSDAFYVEEVFWNDTAPQTVFASTYSASDIQNEEYYYPSLKMIRKLRNALTYELADLIEQNHWTKRNGTDRELYLDPVPETDVYILYRKQFTADTWPDEDAEVIAALLAAYMLSFLKSSGVCEQLGDARFDNKGITEDIKKLRAKFFSNVQPVIIGRS